MVKGFDFPWWSQWIEEQEAFASSFAPDILGTGFAVKNVDLLLRGQLPARLLSRGAGGEEDDAPMPVDGSVLALGVLYLLLQTFLMGGVLATLRGEQGTWTVRSVLHGSGFYFGRFLRIALVALLLAWLVFRLNIPLARWADRSAREAVSEWTAIAWILGRHAALLLALLGVSLLSTLAKAITVIEERSSALLAFVSAFGFTVRHLAPTLGLYALVGALGMLLLLVWGQADAAWPVTGYRTQLVALVLMQGLVLGRLALRLTLAGGLVALYRRHGGA
jgi:hypothetical protein